MDKSRSLDIDNDSKRFIIPNNLAVTQFPDVCLAGRWDAFSQVTAIMHL